jgi:hypothetical protein
MVYKQKVMGLLETLEGKLRLIENVSQGILRMEPKQVNELIQQTKKIREQIQELISIERE